MDNAKWDWENCAAFGLKATESPKKLKLIDWTIVDDGEIDAGSFILSTGGASASDGGHVSSAKSSISASTDSSIKGGIQTPNFKLVTNEGFSGNFSKEMEMKGTEFFETSPSTISSVEPLIGLGLGKRTYFENSGGGANVKNASFSAMPTPSTTSLKKTKTSGQNLPIPRCIVEDCNIDLSMAKEYHRKHKVCDVHSKCPKVIVGGVERRFCQQCSRFHNLSEFDEKKRSCRRRLSDHNARRRKPQQETVQFNSTRPASPFYGGRQHVSFLLNNAPHIHSRSPVNNTWDVTCNSKFALTKEYPLKSNGVGGNDEHMSGIKLPNVINMHGNAANGPLPFKSCIPEVSSPGSKGFLISSHLDAAPEYCRALSLLSSNSWAEPMPLQHQPTIHENDSCVTQHPIMMNSIPQSLSSTDFWLTTGHQSTHPHVQPLATTATFQEIQHCATQYEVDLYSNMMNCPFRQS